MILSDPRRPAPPGIGGKATLDDLFRRAAQRRPDDIALIDPANRDSFTDGVARRITYAQADRMISAIAGRLRRMGLHTDAIIGVQMANTVESVLTLLGVLRAGLIAMPLPLLWRRADLVTALSRVSANALIVTGRVGAANHFDLAMAVAAEIFPVRYVCGFGRDAPDGLIPFDDLFTAEKLDPVPAMERERALPPGPAAHLAIVTWDVSADGLVPVGRNHAELIAGGLAVFLESRLAQNAVIVSTMTMSSFAGLAVGLVPWLLAGGTLLLHQPFDPTTFDTQQRNLRADTVVLPGPIVPQLMEAGRLSMRDGVKNVIGIWRAPERLARAPAWRETRAGMIDVQIFGETGLLATRRGPSGRPAAIPFGPVVAPRGSKSGVIVAEVLPTPKGTVAMRGPMTPRCSFPPGAERTDLPHFKTGPAGHVDTGYACRVDGVDVMLLTGPPPGIGGVGGYRFLLRELQDVVSSVGGGGTLAALPDALCGHRLAGNAPDKDRVQKALTELGVNPLLVGAFRDRRRPAA